MPNTLINLQYSLQIAVLAASIGVWILRFGLPEKDINKHIMPWLILFVVSQMSYQLFSFWRPLAILISFGIPIVLVLVWESYHIKAKLFKFLQQKEIIIDDDVQHVTEYLKRIRGGREIMIIDVYLKNGDMLSTNFVTLAETDVPKDLREFHLLPNGDVVMIVTKKAKAGETVKDVKTFQHDWGTAITCISGGEILRIQYRLR